MRKLLLIIALISFCLSGNSQKKAGKIPVTTSSKKALSFYNEAWKASEDVDIPRFNELSSRALAEDPDFFMAHYQRAIYAAYFGQEKNFIKEATAAVNCKAKISPGEKVLKDALTSLLADRKADLTVFGKKLVEMYPGDVNSQLYLMTYQYLIKDYDGQIMTINNALKISDRKDYLYNALAYAHMAKGQLKEAEAALDKYIAISPQLPNPYDSKGDLYMLTKEYDKAYENFTRANSIDTAWSKAKALRAKNLIAQARQFDLMRKFVGSWQSGLNKDTITVFEMIPYDNGLLQINSRVIKGTKRILFTGTYTFDPAAGCFKSYASWPNGRSEIWRVTFTSDKDVDFARVEDMKATKVMYHNTATFDTPDQITANTYNSDNVRTSTSKWVRTGMTSGKNEEISAMYHRLNPKDVDAILTENFTGQQNDGQMKWNKEQHRGFLSNGSYKRDSVFHQVAEGDWVATRFLREMFYNGDTIRAVAMQFKRFENGKIAEIWEYFDPSQAERKKK